MTWRCAAIDHGVAVFPNGKIGPCCQISDTYLKPISVLTNPDRFSDLKTSEPPAACEVCHVNEYNQIKSYRQVFNSLNNQAKGLQFVDLRNTNHCNLTCRYCGPHFSSAWAKELGQPGIVRQDIEHYKDTLITDSLHWMYFTGGEPLINPEHWQLLEELVSSGRSEAISLMYNTNITTIKYKNLDIVDLWSKFKEVSVNCSIDAVGTPLEYIRSGTVWEKINNNIQILKQINNVTVVLTPVLSILNIWFISDLFEYATTHRLKVTPILLTGPDYLSLDVIPDQLKSQALEQISKIEKYLDINLARQIKEKIENNVNQCLFTHTMTHTLLLDNNRSEKLFDLLPFKSIATDTILKNHEYE